MEKDSIQIKGFMRLCLEDVRGPHAGRKQLTPWQPNIITSDGSQDYIVGAIGSLAGSKYITHMAVGTQTNAPTSDQTSASGEFDTREATTNSFVADGTLQATASWETNQATQSNLGAVALYNTSSGGTAGSIATFATSAKTTDQTLSATYQWRFS